MEPGWLIVLVCGWVGVCSVTSNSATPQTVACQAPLSLGFSQKEYWSRLPFPPPGDLPEILNYPPCLKHKVQVLCPRSSVIWDPFTFPAGFSPLRASHHMPPPLQAAWGSTGTSLLLHAVNQCSDSCLGTQREHMP